MKRFQATAALAVLALVIPSLGAAQAGYGKPTAIVVSGPEAGQRAPNFLLPWATRDTIGTEPFEFWKTRGKPVVLAFYPRDFTQGCTAEWQTFTEQADSLFGPDVVVVGISADSLETHRRFAQSLNSPFVFLSDTNQAVAKDYGSRSSTPGYNRRTVYVIGKDGRVRYRDLRFNALDTKSYAQLRAAVQDARR